jgi:hypothetical protein
MGLSHEQAARQQAALQPDVAPDGPKKLERGHGRGKYVDRSRTDAIDLRGFPCVGFGVAGVIPGTRPGDSVAALERDERAINNASAAEQRAAVRAGMKAARQRLRPPTTGR